MEEIEKKKKKKLSFVVLGIADSMWLNVFYVFCFLVSVSIIYVNLTMEAQDSARHYFLSPILKISILHENPIIYLLLSTNPINSIVFRWCPFIFHRCPEVVIFFFFRNIIAIVEDVCYNFMTMNNHMHLRKFEYQRIPL